MIGNTKAWIPSIGEIRFGSLNPSYNYAVDVFNLTYTIPSYNSNPGYYNTSTKRLFDSITLGPGISGIFYASNMGDLWLNGNWNEERRITTIRYLNTYSDITDRECTMEYMFDQTSGKLDLYLYDIESPSSDYRERTHNGGYNFIVFKY